MKSTKIIVANENISSMTDVNQSLETGTKVLISKQQKCMPIIDADEYQIIKTTIRSKPQSEIIISTEVLE
ncbi:MAG: hypothetical protein PHF13_06175 [Acholeplasmataceae bacterium]|nr:hypothetical protein [Acholeplasmataceae bacterium]